MRAFDILACPVSLSADHGLILVVLLAFWAATGALARWAAGDACRGLGLLMARINPRRERFDDLPPGKVALRGEVVPLDPLEAPETGQPCVYAAITVDRWDKNATMGGFSGQWLRAEDSEEAAPFKITDGRNTVLVEPDGGQFHAEHVETGERRQDDGSLIRYTERVIRPGDDVLVVGQARQRGGFEPSAAYRGHNYRTVISVAGGELRVIQPPSGLTHAALSLVSTRMVAMAPFIVISLVVLSVVLGLTF